MARRVKGPDGVIHEFPDDATDAEIAAALQGSSASPPAQQAQRSALDRMLSMLPSIGGGVGGAVGGMPGAAMGGAAGQGYLQLARHASEIPGAVADVGRNLIQQPGATLKGAASGLMEGVKDTGIEAALQSLYELGGKVVVGGLGSAGRAVYRGYLKPSLAKSMVSKADQIVETALQEALPITKGGKAQANTIIKELRAEVDAELAKTPGTVDLHQVAERVRAFAKRRYFRPGTPPADYEAALAVADSIDKHPSLGIAPGVKVTKLPVSATNANLVKRGIDQAVGDANFGVERGATKTTQKIARNQMRTSIEKVAPQVAPLNAREAKLIDTAKALSRAVAREENKSPLIGVNTLASVALGGAEMARGGGPYVAAAKAAAARLALTPAVASRAAIVAYRLGKLPGNAPANVGRLVEMAIRAVLETEQQPGNGP